MSPLKKNRGKRSISVILCAGKGTRFGKKTQKIPKPLIKIKVLNNVSILSHLIKNLINFNVYKIIIITGYLNEKIEAFLEKLIRKKQFLHHKLVIIHSGEDYKKGPLFSLLSIQNNKNIYKEENIFIIFPGDTIFYNDLLKEIFNLIHENFDLILTKPVIFYQLTQAKDLYKSYKCKKKPKTEFISILELDQGKPNPTIKEIKKIDLTSVPKQLIFKKVIPVLVLNYNVLEILSNLSKINPVEEIREILNIFLKKDYEIISFNINPKYKYYDIDTSNDLNHFILLKKEKKGGQ